MSKNRELRLKVNAVEETYIVDLLESMRAKSGESSPALEQRFGADFEKSFRYSLLISHCFFKTPLYMLSFERAFIRAARTTGQNVIQADDGQRYWDVSVGGDRISIKSSQAKDLKADFLHVSKLCEASWIQDMRSAKDRAQRTKELFEEYIGTVHSIVQLRHFKKKGVYELVEFPCSLMASILNAPVSCFESDGPTINIPVGEEKPDLQIKIDRSDAKITIGRIRKSRCNLLATWKLDPVSDD